MAHQIAEKRKRAVELKDIAVKHFRAENWLEVGAITDCLEIVEQHDRLLRSLSFEDPDYPGAALAVLLRIIERQEGNIELIEQYLSDKFNVAYGLQVSSKPSSNRKIVFAPNVFEVPSKPLNFRLVAIMMPFSIDFNVVHAAISQACSGSKLDSQRADNIWEHDTVMQDIFPLYFDLRSWFVISQGAIQTYFTKRALRIPLVSTSFQSRKIMRMSHSTCGIIDTFAT